MSAIGAAHDAPTINSRLHALSDAELAASGIAYTVLKPHFFDQNFAMIAPTVASQGMIYFPLADGRNSFVDTRDISELAAKVLTTSGHEGKTYTVTGPASISMNEVATTIGEVIGKDVKYTALPFEGARRSFEEMRIDEWSINSMKDYMAAFGSGWGDFVSDDFERVMGKAPRSFKQFASDFAGLFGKA
nr:NmrA family NAD(P)-binding protein [Labrys miyagiensis]